MIQEKYRQIQIETLGQLVRNKLLYTNPLLRPDKLVDFNGYLDFFPLSHGFRIWSSTRSLYDVQNHYFQHSKILLLLSGVATGGKDALRKKIEELAPNKLFKIVTGTSRKPRPDETHTKDYYFYDGARTFLDAAGQEDQGEFLEKTEQSPGRWYGLPKQSLVDALNHPEPILCTHVEMTAWPRVERFIEENYGQNTLTKPFVLKVFVMPEMTAQQYLSERLPTLRPDDYASRAIRSGWELRYAPFAAHFLVTNVIDQTGVSLDFEAKALINIMGNLFPIGTQFPYFHFPEVSPGICNTPDILAFQANQIR